MIKLKKISFDLSTSAIIAISLILFIFLIILITSSLYYYNLLNQDKYIIDRYIENSPVSQIEKEKAEKIINYQSENLLLKTTNIINPFRTFEQETITEIE